MIRFIWQ